MFNKNKISCPITQEVTLASDDIKPSNSDAALLREKRKFGCDISEFEIDSNGNLEKHMLTHSSEQIFSCDICEYKTQHRISLKIHNSIHTGDNRRLRHLGAA